MVRRAENIVNDDVFASFIIFQFVRELDDFELVFLPFLESIWNTLGHRFLIFYILEPYSKSIDFRTAE